MICCICNTELSLFDKFLSSKCYDGVVCKHCKNKFPSLFSITGYTSKEIVELINYVQKNKKEFFCTTHYGRLFLDEVHGLIAYNKGEKLDDKKTSLQNNIFKADDLDLFEISLSEPKISRTVVYSNVLLYMHLQKFNASFNKIIKSNEKSTIKRLDNRSMVFDPPMGYVFIRAVANQMISNSISNFRKLVDELIAERNKIDRERANLSQTELFKAKTILMLDDSFTQEDVKKHYRHLTKCLHPDVNQGYGDEYMQKINWAYELLSEKEKL